MIKSIGHLAFDCYDYEKTLDFYTRVLGFEPMFNLHNEADAIEMTCLRVSDETFLQLSPQSGEAPAQSGSASHLCFHVDDIEITAKLLAERGGVLENGGEIQAGKDGNLQLWTRDPEGNRIELMQIMPDSLQSRAIERIKSTKIAG